MAIDSPQSTISIVICTRGRPSDLQVLLKLLGEQTCLPSETIVVDGSSDNSARTIAGLVDSLPAFKGARLKWIHAPFLGLPASRNVGLGIASSDLVLFLDDDVLPSDNLVESLALFFRDNPAAIGAQPRVLIDPVILGDTWSPFLTIVYRALMLSYYEDDCLKVRRSGLGVYPRRLTKVIQAERLMGCSSCYKRSAIASLAFDENLKRWGYMEDLDFSVRVSRLYPHSLYVIPNANLLHKQTSLGRQDPASTMSMTVTYWFYVFFKDIYAASMLNLVSFFWALFGYMSLTVAIFVKYHRTCDSIRVISLIRSYAFAIRKLREIRKGRLDFFNEAL